MPSVARVGEANGRVYDPVLARFLSPDPYVQAPDFTQSFNRYAYCLNNPFKYVDPSGEFLTWSINSNGFSIGLNFCLAGVPLGFGISVGFSGGGSVGIYGEVGYRVGCVGVTANQSLITVMNKKYLFFVFCVWLSNNVFGQFVSTVMKEKFVEMEMSVNLLKSRQYFIALKFIGDGDSDYEYGLSAGDYYYHKDTLILKDAYYNYTLKFLRKNDELFPIRSFHG